jgi:hypothetical protein
VRPDTRLHPTKTQKHRVNPCNAGVRTTGMLSLSHQGEAGPAGAFSLSPEKQAARTSDAVGIKLRAAS